MVDVSDVLVELALVNAVMVKVPAVHTAAYCQVEETVPPILTRDINALLEEVKPDIEMDLVPAERVVCPIRPAEVVMKLVIGTAPKVPVVPLLVATLSVAKPVGVCTLMDANLLEPPAMYKA